AHAPRRDGRAPGRASPRARHREPTPRSTHPPGAVAPDWPHPADPSWPGRPFVSGSAMAPPRRIRARAPTNDVGCHNRTAPPRNRTEARGPRRRACASADPRPSWIGDPTIFPDFAADAALGYRHDDPHLVNIKPDI